LLGFGFEQQLWRLLLLLLLLLLVVVVWHLLLPVLRVLWREVEEELGVRKGGLWLMLRL
jgi:membrane protein YdbS with pleckstrin-like domain